MKTILYHLIMVGMNVPFQWLKYRRLNSRRRMQNIQHLIAEMLHWNKTPSVRPGNDISMIQDMVHALSRIWSIHYPHWEAKALVETLAFQSLNSIFRKKKAFCFCMGAPRYDPLRPIHIFSLGDHNKDSQASLPSAPTVMPMLLKAE